VKGRAGVYQFINKTDPAKSYVGSSINLWDRIRQQLYEDTKPKHAGRSLLYRAGAKYSWEGFRLVRVHAVKESILAREQYYLDLIRPYYYILTEAGSSLGYSATPETRAKMSASQGTALYAFTASAKDPQLTFSSMRKAAAHFQCSRGTILNHVKSGLLFKNQWLLSFKAIISPCLGLSYSTKNAGGMAGSEKSCVQAGSAEGTSYRHSAETRQKMREAQLWVNNPMWGKDVSVETRAELRSR
jgi:hypothetical protein